MGKKRAKAIKMNYDNYERAIIERYQVAIEGWPCEAFGNPGSIGRDNVYRLLAALDGPQDMRTCYWVKLSDQQLAAR